MEKKKKRKKKGTDDWRQAKGYKSMKQRSKARRLSEP